MSTAVNGILFTLLFLSGSLSIWSSQTLIWPMKFILPQLYRKMSNYHKRSFGVLLTAICQYFTKTEVQFILPPTLKHKQVDGIPFIDWKKRAVIVANHQLYNDWIYAWWLAYTGNIHEAPLVMLKESIRRIPVFGWSADMWDFLFMARNWSKDESRIKHSMENIAAHPEQPIWLVMFPEGTVTSANTVGRSRDYAAKVGKKAPMNMLFPRVRGLEACFKGLDGAIDTLYDFTVYYDGIPEGKFGENWYSLKRMYWQNLYPKTVKIHVREFAVKNIPTDSQEFERWLVNLWYEKDQIFQNLRGDVKYDMQGQVRLKSWTDLLKVYSFTIVLLATAVARKWA